MSDDKDKEKDESHPFFNEETKKPWEKGFESQQDEVKEDYRKWKKEQENGKN